MFALSVPLDTVSVPLAEVPEKLATILPYS